MNKQSLLAVSALAVVVAMSSATPVSLVRTLRPAQSQWAYAVGMSGEEALAYSVGSAIACGLIGGVGGVACGVTAAL
ncbi:MAG: hypothetical protein KJ066_18685 [Acidobacteria bacterium]|nr:hypothetical protein [Acidobacteriota bacterium]